MIGPPDLWLSGLRHLVCVLGLAVTFSAKYLLLLQRSFSAVDRAAAPSTKSSFPPFSKTIVVG